MTGEQPGLTYYPVDSRTQHVPIIPDFDGFELANTRIPGDYPHLFDRGKTLQFHPHGLPTIAQ